MRKKDKIIAIVQARMSSARLPCKVLMDLCGKPVLWHVVNRLKRSSLIGEIVIATTVNEKDNAIVGFCKKNNFDYYRGSEEDVLDRYYQTAKKFKADIITRITSDCPLIDPEVVDKVIKAYLDGKKNFDGATNSIRRTYPRGLDAEVFSFKALEKCWEQAGKGYQREHVTVYMYEYPELFKLVSVENNKDLSAWRLVVDEVDDFELVKKIYENLFLKNKYFSMKDIEVLLEKNYSFLEINKKVKQKQLTDECINNN